MAPYLGRKVLNFIVLWISGDYKIQLSNGSL
jgi:hypothetical protein